MTFEILRTFVCLLSFINVQHTTFKASLAAADLDGQLNKQNCWYWIGTNPKFKSVNIRRKLPVFTYVMTRLPYGQLCHQEAALANTFMKINKVMML